MKHANLILLLAIIVFSCLGLNTQAHYFNEQIEILQEQNAILSEREVTWSQQVQGLENWVTTLSTQIETKEIVFEEEEILAKLLYCEAGHCSWEAQTYVCSAILNYCERNNVTIEEAAHNIDSFSVAPFVDSAEPLPIQYEVIYYVLDEGRIPDICYFRIDYYHGFGTPVCNIGNLYFSKP